MREIICDSDQLVQVRVDNLTYFDPTRPELTAVRFDAKSLHQRVKVTYAYLTPTGIVAPTEPSGTFRIVHTPVRLRMAPTR